MFCDWVDLHTLLIMTFVFPTIKDSKIRIGCRRCERTVTYEMKQYTEPFFFGKAQCMGMSGACRGGQNSNYQALNTITTIAVTANRRFASL
jgi:hypothetical protein